MRTLIALLISLPVVAAADPRQDADGHARKGVALYNLGKFGDAIEEFEEAYKLFQSDALLFNLAQAHRKLEHCESALRYYNQFMAGAPSPVLAAQVTELLPTLQAACRMKDAPPNGAPEPATAPAVPATPPTAPALEARTEANLEASIHITGAATVGGVISGGTAPVSGVRVTATTPWLAHTELGAAFGAAQLWRGDADHNATILHLAAAIQYRAPIAWGRWTATGELGAAYFSSLASSSGVVPGVNSAGQWAPLARGELGAEHDVAPSWAVRAALAIAVSPRVGMLDDAVGEVDLIVGVRFER
jgi:tetratricopeptide (TPR) repeat protein